MNSITLKLPPGPLLPGSYYPVCNETTLQNSNCSSELCKCTHVVHVPYNALVELILMDSGRGTINHPIHLHGFTFRVIGMEHLNGTVTADRIKELDRKGLLRRNFCNPAHKCVMPGPSPGYSIIRFRADNPGMYISCVVYTSRCLMYRSCLYYMFKVTGISIAILSSTQ